MEHKEVPRILAYPRPSRPNAGRHWRRNDSDLGTNIQELADFGASHCQGSPKREREGGRAIAREGELSEGGEQQDCDARAAALPSHRKAESDAEKGSVKMHAGTKELKSCPYVQSPSEKQALEPLHRRLVGKCLQKRITCA